MSYRQKGKDLALGRLSFLTGSVSRCLGSSCGRKDMYASCISRPRVVFLALASPIVFC